MSENMSGNDPEKVIDPRIFQCSNPLITISGVPVIDVETIDFIDRFHIDNSEEKLFRRLHEGLSENPYLLTVGTKVVKEYPEDIQWKIFIPALKMVYMVDLQTKVLLQTHDTSSDSKIYSALERHAGISKLRDGIPVIPHEVCDAILQVRDKSPGDFFDNIFDRVYTENNWLLEYLDDIVLVNNPRAKKLRSGMQATMLSMYAAIDRTYNILWTMNDSSIFLRDSLRHYGQLPTNHPMYDEKPASSVQKRKKP